MPHRLFTDPAIRRTVLCLLLVEFLWGMGMYFTLPATTIPSYLNALGASKYVIGLIAIAMAAFPMALQLFGRVVFERFRRKKAGLIQMHIAVIVPYFAIPVCDLCLAGKDPLLLISLIVALLSFSQIAMSFILPVWLDMLGQVIPLPIRGRYFGVSMGCLAIGGILGAAVLAALQHWLGAWIFRGAFLASAVCYSFSMVALWQTPIAESTFVHPPEPSLAIRLRTALQACGPGSDFGRLLFSNALQALALAIVPFLIIYATSPQGLQLDRGIFGMMTVVQAIGGTVGAVLLGLWVDQRGPRWPWMTMTLLIPALLACYPHGAFLPILYACTFLAGVLTTSWSVFAPALLELTPDGDKSGYLAMANLAALPAAIVGPLLYAWLIAAHSYHAAFLTAGIAGLVACLFAATIRGRQRSRRTMREARKSAV